jgi:hypothetical protein
MFRRWSTGLTPASAGKLSRCASRLADNETKVLKNARKIARITFARRRRRPFSGGAMEADKISTGTIPHRQGIFAGLKTKTNQTARETTRGVSN